MSAARPPEGAKAPCTGAAGAPSPARGSDVHAVTSVGVR